MPPPASSPLIISMLDTPMTATPKNTHVHTHTLLHRHKHKHTPNKHTHTHANTHTHTCTHTHTPHTHTHGTHTHTQHTHTHTKDETKKDTCGGVCGQRARGLGQISFVWQSLRFVLQEGLAVVVAIVVAFCGACSLAVNNSYLQDIPPSSGEVEHQRIRSLDLIKSAGSSC